MVRTLPQHCSRVKDEGRVCEDKYLKLHSKCGQAISADARQYVVLHGHSNDWSSVSTTLKFYKKQLRTCKSRALSKIICNHCGKTIRKRTAGRESKKKKAISLHLSSFRVLKRNASGGEVHFEKLRLHLEDVLLADVSWRGMLRVVALPSPLRLLDIDEQVVD